MENILEQVARVNKDRIIEIWLSCFKFYNKKNDV